MSTLFVTPEVARSLGLDWITAWLSIGGSLQVQDMPAEQPAMMLDKQTVTPVRIG